MKAFRTALAATAILSIGSAAIAQNDDTESLKMEALRALMPIPQMKNQATLPPPPRRPGVHSKSAAIAAMKNIAGRVMQQAHG